MGIDPASQSPAQYPAVHSIMSMGVQQSMGRGFSGLCSATFPKRVLPGASTACAGASTSNYPFIFFLKSPIGDLRNKLFSDPTSKFYNPTSSEADDTITFNHYLRGGFNGQDQLSFRRSDRATFGGMSGDEVAWLDGRVAGDLTAAQVWTYFMYEGTTGTNDGANLRYNKFVPSTTPGYGKWDYNEDGIPDTIRVPDCGQFGCAQPWYDTIAGGFSNLNGANVQNFIGAGPFALKANDTASFIFYVTSVPYDTLQYKVRYNNVVKAYFNSWEGANAYPAPTITPSNIQISSAWLRDSTGGNQDTQIRIQINMPPKQDDPYMKSVLDRINSNEAIAVTLRNLNPTLIATVTERWHQNLASVLIFKSCDRGVSWTSATQCTAATANYQTRDEAGNPVGIGWRYRTLITADPITGALSSNVLTETVESGHDYLYSFVTKTRALKDIQVVLSQTVNAAGQVTARTTGTLQDALNVDIDSLVSPLKSSGPSTALVYAPLSVPAGTIYSRLDTTRAQGVNTARVSTTARSASIKGDFRMRFGNQFVIRRTVNSATGGVTSTIIRRSIYANAARSPTDPVTVNFIASADTFTSNTGFTYGSPAASALVTVPDSVVGTTTYYSQTVSTPGYVVADATPGTKPYFVAIGTTYINFTQNTAEYEAASFYAGFTATITAETAPPSARLARVLRGPADTLNDGVTTSNGVVYQSAGSTLLGPGGYYRLTWADDAFGPKGGDFRWGTYEQMKPVWDASLAARATGSMTFVPSADSLAYFRSLPSFPGGAAGTRPMVAARLPFTVTGSGGKPARVIMLQRYIGGGNVPDSLLKNSRVLGTTGDTTRLPIPVDLWMPGDTLYVLEKILTDSTVTIGAATVSIVADTTINGRVQTLPIRVEREIYGLRLLLACASAFQPARNTCNPLALGTRGTGAGQVPFQAGAYLPFRSGFVSVTHLNRTFDQNSEFKLTAQPFQASGRALTKSDMDRVFVVPNPYIVQSGFDAVASNRAVAASLVRFINVPARGTLRIYSISGQLMQQLTWTESDLIIPATVSLSDSTRAVQHGDLPYNLRTREGLDLGPGLYMFVLTAGGSVANGQVARGKFVVIR